MKVFFPLSIFFTGLLCSSSTFSITACESMTSFFIVEAERKDDPRFSNKLIVRFISEQGDEFSCAGADYAYLSNTEGAYSSVFATVLFLAAQGKMAKIFVDENDKIGSAVRLEYLYPKQ